MKFVLTLLCLVAFTLLNAAELTMYAAPEAAGKGDGSTPENTARLWDAKLWWKIKNELAKTPVTLKLAAGNYYQEIPAKRETSLVLRGIGNEKNRFVMQGAPKFGSVFSRHPNDSKELKGNLFPLIAVRNNSQNITFEGLYFTGDGVCAAGLIIAHSQNILIRNCMWKDFRGVYYSGSGASEGSTNVTWENCHFENVGYDVHAHMLYNSNASSNLTLRNCTMIDSYGDFIRFRNKVENVTVEGCTFIDNGKYDSSPFISFPVFITPKVLEKGGEFYAKGLTVRNNRFEFRKPGKRNWVMNYHLSGFNPPGRDYMFSKKDVAAFKAMDRDARRKYLDDRLDMQAARIKFENNTIINAVDTIVYECWPNYGSNKNFPTEEYKNAFSLSKTLLDPEKK